MKHYLYAAAILFLLSSCVTKKKYDDMLAQKVRLEADLADKNAALDSARSELTNLEDRIATLKKDTTSIGIDLRTTRQNLALLESEHDRLNTHYKNLLNSSGKLNRDIAQQQQQLLAIQENLDRTRKVNDSLSNSLLEREKKVQELEQVLASKEKAVQELKNRITNALLSFKDNDISVEVKNGKVYVSLSEQLLFKSGSVVVDPKGVSALQELSKAIRDQKDLNILVEGHTDNVPISRKSQYMEDNWDLSVMRATSIARILMKGGVSPRQITASGRGEHMPLAPNDAPATRQKNRRTEIIITPDLGELFKILETN